MRNRNRQVCWCNLALPIFTIIVTVMFVGATAFADVTFSGGIEPGDRVRAAEVAFLGSSVLIGLAAILSLARLFRRFCWPRNFAGEALWPAAFSLALSVAVMACFVLTFHRVLSPS